MVPYLAKAGEINFMPVEIKRPSPYYFPPIESNRQLFLRARFKRIPPCMYTRVPTRVAQIIFRLDPAG